MKPNRAGRLWWHSPEAIFAHFPGHLLQRLDHWGWAYALRQRRRIRFMPYRSTRSTRFDQHRVLSGPKVWMGRVDLTRRYAYVTNVVIYWARGQDELWYLATNLPGPHDAIQLYRRRMWKHN